MLKFGNIFSRQIFATICALVALSLFMGMLSYAPKADAAVRPQTRPLHLDDTWKIYCAGRPSPDAATTDQSSDNPSLFLALRLRKSEVISQNNTPCLTDYLTVKFVTNWVSARLFGKPQSINFSLPVKIDGRFKNIGFSFSTNDSDSRNQKRRLADILKDCDVDQTPDDLGLFHIYGNEKSCKSYPARTAKTSAMSKSYAINSPDDIVHMTCYSTCIMSINFNNRIVKLIFSKKRLSNWQTIRQEALALLNRRVVLNYETDRCSGNLCDALMLEWN